MVIEFLKFKVTPELREKFIQKDAEIWTTAISRYPGFLSKEVWIDPNAPAEIVMIIRWATREQWKSIPTEQLDKIDAKFAQQMGKTYELIQSSEYQVRKFPQS